VPTTSGTGSEVARGAIIIVDDHRKLGFHSWHLVPKAAICDPELTFGLPADGDRHGCHSPLHGSLYGLGLQSTGRRHRPGRADPGLGAYRAGHAQWQRRGSAPPIDERKHARGHGFSEGLGCVHSLSHSLGGINPRLHHGTLNAMFLPAVVRFNAEAESVQREDRLNRMAHAMGLSSGSDIPDAVRDMNARLNLPSGLAAMGVERAQFDAIISGALKDHCHATNPRLASAQDYEQMLSTSL
jgi:alcohol dehydrogenase class IV